ncbi:MAG: PKD domain-containing protein [Planctomycetes bacterium]|nr:PKD domain-containing protein [Planctomycetota bacterium]
MQILYANDPSSFDHFGASAGIDGNTAVVGAASAAACVFRFDGATWNEEQALVNSDWEFHSVAVAGDVIILGAPFAAVGSIEPGAACVFRFDGAAWVEEQVLSASDAGDGDRFGYSVAVSEEVAVVGSLFAGYLDDLAGAAYVFRFDGMEWIEEQKLTADDGTMDDQLGYAVSIAGDLVVAGAPEEDDGGAASGAAYIFRFDGAAWMQETKLVPSVASASSRFGGSVAAATDLAIVGAPRSDDAGIDSGAAYAYRYDGAVWVEEPLIAADVTAGDAFGGAVAVAGDLVAVGSSWFNTPGAIAADDDNGPAAGSIYLFSFDGSNWLRSRKLVASDGPSSRLGSAVALSGDYVLGGAPYHGAQGTQAGAAFVFAANAELPAYGSLCDFAAPAKVTASDGESFDGFGRSVALGAGVAIAGSPLDDDLGIDSGAAYIYRFDGTNWSEEQKLTASDGGDGAQFGYSVAIDGDVALVGSPFDSGAGIEAGAALLFRYDGGGWTEEGALSAGGIGFYEWFGTAVAIEEDVAVVGAMLDDEVAADAGAAYVFRYDGASWEVEAKLIPIDGTPSGHFGNAVAISADRIVVGARHDSGEGLFAGAVHVFRFDGVDWVAEQKLHAQDAALLDEFGASVAIFGAEIAIGSPYEIDNLPGAGAVYVFRHDESDWVQTQKLQSPLAGNAGEFGGTIALGEGLLVIAGIEGLSNGEAHVFAKSGDTWASHAALEFCGSAVNDAIGGAVAARGTTLCIGAHNDRDKGMGSGSMYLIAGGFHPVAGPIVADTLDDSTVAFSVAVTGSEPLSYFWDFGDGATSPEPAPVHAYFDLGDYFVSVEVSNPCGNILRENEIAAGIRFRRGDVDGNEKVVALTDALYLLTWGFLDGAPPACRMAADADDDGSVSALTDSLHLLLWTFANGPPPPAPGASDCGFDGTPDDLDCASPPSACR